MFLMVRNSKGGHGDYAAMWITPESKSPGGIEMPQRIAHAVNRPSGTQAPGQEKGKLRQVLGSRFTHQCNLPASHRLHKPSSRV